MVLAKKLLKRVTTTIRLILKIKVKKSRKILKIHLGVEKLVVLACKAHLYRDGTRKYDLCLTEKLSIMKVDLESLVNTLDEFVSKCRHLNKFTLSFFKKK